MSSASESFFSTENAAQFFDKHSESYERLTGGCTREIAQFLLSQPPEVDISSVVLDNACATGIITGDILSSFPDSSGRRPKIYAADISPSMVSNLADVAKAKGWAGASDGLIQSSVMDAQELSFQDEMFTHSYTNFGIFFAPEPEKVAREIHRTLKAGGHAYVTSWAKLGYLPVVQGAQKAVRPDDTPWTVPFHEEWSRDGKLERVLEAGGFDGSKIKVQKKTASFQGADLDDLVEIMYLGFGEHVTKEWSEGEKEKWKQLLSENMTEMQRKEARVEMEAFVAVAEK